tara:strand:- start:268 stop:936 length:669 start_codon:yes stop_codon:yes gene_type:complete
MKKYLVTILISLFILISISYSNDILIKGNFGMSNTYIWRGMAQANTGDPAIYGGLDAALSEKVSIGTWVSNVGFSDNTTYEWDIYASYSDTINIITDIGYSLGLIYYAYPDSGADSSIDFTEASLGFSKGSFSFTYYVLLSGPNDAEFADDSYFLVGLNETITQDFEFFVTVGYYTGSTMITGKQVDYSIGLSKDGFTFATLGTDDSNQNPIMQIKYELEVF